MWWRRPIPGHELGAEEIELPSPWDVSEWQNMPIVPLFVGGPLDGRPGDARPRWQLPLAFQVPIFPSSLQCVAGVPPTSRVAFGTYLYKIGRHLDAVTVEYR